MMVTCRHPQILLLPLQQFQRSIGYLLGQGLTKAEILRMWGQRAGLLVEPLDRLHGEVLALRASDRPLQAGPPPSSQPPGILPGCPVVRQLSCCVAHCLVAALQTLPSNALVLATSGCTSTCMHTPRHKQPLRLCSSCQQPAVLTPVT